MGRRPEPLLAGRFLCNVLTFPPTMTIVAIAAAGVFAVTAEYIASDIRAISTDEYVTAVFGPSIVVGARLIAGGQ